MSGLRYFDSADSPNVEARFALYSHYLTQRDDKGVLRKTKKDEIACFSRVKGSRDEGMDFMRPHNEEEMKRNYARAWASHQGDTVIEELGTPLEEFFDEEPQTLDAFREMGWRTVESFVESPENIACKAGIGWRKKQNEAREFLRKRQAPTHAHQMPMPEFKNSAEKATYEAAVRELNSNFEKFRNANSGTEPAMAAIEEPVETTEPPAAKRRGRPPKQKEEVNG